MRYALSGTQLKVSHSLIINKTGPIKDTSAGTIKQKREARVTQSFYLILTMLCFFI
jgi:hypothetical protein